MPAATRSPRSASHRTASCAWTWSRPTATAHERHRRRDLLYVLNAGSNEIAGFRVVGGELAPVDGSTQPTSGPAAAPGQVSFTPDGDQLIVAERGTQLLGVYPVYADGVAGSPSFRPVLRRGAVRL
jgi:6-phosphogluconolactonase (cycloisomerase 2 family)